MSRRRSRWKPPHPARTINTPRTCPTGKTRFATVDLARQAIDIAGTHTPLDAVACKLCGGAHIKDTT